MARHRLEWPLLEVCPSFFLLMNLNEFAAFSILSCGAMNR
jgi:hypothetical protein